MRPYHMRYFGMASHHKGWYTSQVGISDIITSTIANGVEAADSSLGAFACLEESAP